MRKDLRTDCQHIKPARAGIREWDKDVDWLGMLSILFHSAPL